MMSRLIILSILFTALNSNAATSTATRAPAAVNTGPQTLSCNVTAQGEPTKTLIGKLSEHNNSDKPLAESFGDYNVFAFWDAKNHILSAGVIDTTNLSTASVVAVVPGQIAQLFVSKANKSLSLACFYF